MLKDIWNSLRLYIEDRLSSPFLVAFLFAWTIINYRFFLIVFNDSHFTEKMSLIEHYVFPTLNDKLLKGLGYPLLAALIYVLIYPFIDRLFFKAWRWHQNRLTRTRHDADQQRPVSEQDRAQILSYVHQVQRQHNEEKQQWVSVIEQQRVRISELEAQATAPTLPSPRQPPARAETEEVPDRLLDQEITDAAVDAYLRYRYPDKPTGGERIGLALLDLDRGTYNRVRQLHRVMQRAKEAVDAYAQKRPSMFKYGLDHLTKSLGFADKQFRQKHSFAAESLQEFAQHDDAVARAAPEVRTPRAEPRLYALPPEAEKTSLEKLSFYDLGDLIVSLAKEIDGFLSNSMRRSYTEHGLVNQTLAFLPRLYWLYSEAKQRGIKDNKLEAIISAPRAQLTGSTAIQQLAQLLESFGTEVKVRGPLNS
jgi:hypothetical protein